MGLSKTLAAVLASSAALSSVAAQEQQVLGGLQDTIYQVVEDVLDIPTEAKGLWDELSLLVPGFMEKAQTLITAQQKPKAHKRKPDSEWDHVVKGADIQSMWVERDGVNQRKVDGSLEAYNLRAKKVDPKALGVDKVKQYSGYLDDEANDKHLFYCKPLFRRCRTL